MEEVIIDHTRERNQNMDRYMSSEVDDSRTTLLQKFAIGAVATAGAMAVANRTGLSRRVARSLDTNLSSAKGAFKETAEHFNLSGKDLRLNQFKEMADFYKERYRELLNISQSRYENILGSRDFDTLRYLRQRANLIEKEVPYHLREGLFVENVIKEIEKQGSVSSEQLQDIRRAVAKGRTGILRTGRDADIESLLKQQGVEDSSLTDLLNRVRRSADVAPTKEEELAWFSSLQDKLRESTAKDMSELIKPDGLYRKGMMGSGQRQATVADVLDLHRSGKATLPAGVEEQLQDVLKYNKSFEEAVFDKHLYVNVKDGKVSGFSDYKAFNNIGRDTMEWWSHTMPGGIFHFRSIINTRDARELGSFRVFKRGTVQPFLNSHMGKAPDHMLLEDLIYANGRFIKLFDSNVVNKGDPLTVLNPDRKMVLTSARYGAISDMSRQMSGIMTDGKRTIMEKDVSDNRIMKMLDLGGQKRDSMGANAHSVVSKFFDKDWDRRKVSEALDKGVTDIKEFYNIRRFVSTNADGFSTRAMNELRSKLPENIRKHAEGINFSRDADILELFERIGADENLKRSSSFDYLYRSYMRNPDGILSKTRPKSQTSLFLGGQVETRTGLDDIRKEISKEFLNQVAVHDTGGVVSPSQAYHAVREVLDRSFKEGRISKKDLSNAERLITEQMLDGASSGASLSYENILSEVNQLLTGSTEASLSFQRSLKQMSREVNPLWHMKTNARHKNIVDDEYIAIGKADFFENIRSFGGIKDLAKQLSPFTGRRNLEDVTPLTIYGSYFPAYRLQDALGSMGLGFSDSSMGSSAQIWSSLFVKRGLPIVGIYEGYQYGDYLLDRYTDAGITERWESYKADERLRDARRRDQKELNDALKRERMLRPGIEHLEAMPSAYIPFFGEVGQGHFLNSVFNHLLGGEAIVNERDVMTEEETLEDLLHGVDERRKGRWWAFGSKTPYRGANIIEYAPNSYRMAISGWKDAETDAPREEKYRHSLFPTFENPLGALSFLIGTRDPYWWEKRHYEDRPYLLTGALFNRNTPFLGDIGNATIGELLKPTREMHPEYWEDPESYHEQYATPQRREMPSYISARISPSGRIDYREVKTPVDYGATPIYYSPGTKEDNLSKEDKRYWVLRETDALLDPSKYNPEKMTVVINAESGEVAYAPQAVLDSYSSIPDFFEDAKTGLGNRTVEVPRNRDFNLSYDYHDDIQGEKLDNLLDPRGLEWQVQEALRNWIEPLGVYNWLGRDELLNWNPQQTQAVIARADEASNYSKDFWDQELGSFIGSLSEIGRRFIRRDSSMMVKYNPIRNTMPDWMPGEDYMINFKEGDPYAKVPHGVYRLPGDAYERINQLHPDETGYYGAFDKFKILADVAPWSDEYRFWRDYVTQYEEDPELRKRAAEIKRQVARRKQKHEFQDYMFKDAELDKEKVTVTRFLDDYTFLTEEYGDQPIRLAGVNSRVKAEGVLQQYFDVGDMITIGIDADETRRVASDTYGTMRAVIFRGIESLNRQLIEKGEMRENETDFSAPGVWARFTPQEISRGARWERIAHYDSALNTKFMPVRTAVEEYERNEVYGRQWATWADLGIRDYGIPAIQSMIGRDSMVQATVSGLLMGGVLGRFVFGGGTRTRAGLIIGGSTGFLGNLYGKYYQHKNEERWLPARIRKEHEINEYFDILEYMKYRGLFEKSKQELLEMGYDVDRFLDHVEAKEEQTREERRALEERRKELYLTQPEGWEDERRAINLELKKIDERWDEVDIPVEMAQALHYKDRFETTLYGVDPYGDRTKVMQAFPYKDKAYFNAFANAKKSDREKILSLVPESQGRIYQAIWGDGLRGRKPLSYYAEKYNIPDADWVGWSPEYSLEDIRVRTILEEGLVATDFNIWDDDIAQASRSPKLPAAYNESSFKGFKDAEQNIREVLEGQGLKNVRVTVRNSNGGETHTRLTYEEERDQEIINEFMYNMNKYV